MARVNWMEGELLKLLIVYCELPFGRMHARNPAIVGLAQRLGRTPSAVALKMVNFASLDPTIQQKGMSNVSKLDREVWNKFLKNIDYYLSSESSIHGELQEPQSVVTDLSYFGSDIAILTTARQGQQRFRKVILASYENRCAISGLADEQLLVASHIAPWAELENRRLDPRNGICLNALLDRAFDRGIISLSDSYEVLFSERVSDDTRTKLRSMGQKFSPPSKFLPDTDLLRAHRDKFGFA